MKVLKNTFAAITVALVALMMTVSFASAAVTSSQLEALGFSSEQTALLMTLLGGSTTTTTTTSTYVYQGEILKVGSRGSQVTALQTCLASLGYNPGSNIDGIYGSITATAVKAFQASKGLVVDGVVGQKTGPAYQAACTPTTTVVETGTGSTTSFTSTGDAGDLTIDQTSTDVDSSVKEGDEGNVLGLKLEAEDSDIAITNVKVEFENNSGNGSTRLSKYLDEVLVMLGDEEVGSADASDFTRDGSVYSKSINLDGAVISEGDIEKLYVVAVVADVVDDVTADFDVTMTSLRWMDESGIVISESLSYMETFGFDDANADDSISIKSSSDNPDASNIIVDENSDSDNELVGAFRLKVDADSSDIDLYDGVVVFNVDNYDVNGDSTVNASDDSTSDSAADSVISSATIVIDGTEVELDLDSANIVDGAGTFTYTFDFDGDTAIDSGDTVDAEIYVTFADQDGNYNSGMTISAEVDGSDFNVEGEDDFTVSGTFTGEIHTLLVEGAAVTFASDGFTAENVTDGIDGTIYLNFEVEAVETDLAFADDASDFGYTLTGATETDAVVTCSGLTANGSGDFTVYDGQTKTCRLSLKFNGTTGFVKLTLDSVLGTDVTNVVTAAF